MKSEYDMFSRRFPFFFFSVRKGELKFVTALTELLYLSITNNYNDDFLLQGVFDSILICFGPDRWNLLFFECSGYGLLRGRGVEANEENSNRCERAVAFHRKCN